MKKLNIELIFLALIMAALFLMSLGGFCIMNWYHCYKYVVSGGSLGNPDLIPMLQARKQISTEIGLKRIILDDDTKARLSVLDNQIDETHKKLMGACHECSI